PAPPVRTALVGVGYWGPKLARCAYALPEIELVAVCDISAERRDRLARQYPNIHTTASFEEVVEDESVEAVILATPISTHYELARESLERGRHVLVEKPLATTGAEALELAELARDRGLVLVPGHTFLYSPPVNYVRGVIASGELGEIYAISSSRVNLGIHQSDKSVLWDLAPHDFSILRYWLGEMPAEVSVLGRDCIVDGIPDVAFINMRFASGPVAHVELAWLAPSKLRRTTIIGSDKMAVYDDTSSEPVRIFNSGVTLDEPRSFGEYQLSYRVGDIVSPRLENVEPLMEELTDFADSIRSGVPARSTAELGVDVVRMIEQADFSIVESGGAGAGNGDTSVTDRAHRRPEATVVA
ncbi:MAG: Gfo/Idh/MocA family protein, partial [Gaiellales bacterium]